MLKYFFHLRRARSAHRRRDRVTRAHSLDSDLSDPTIRKFLSTRTRRVAVWTRDVDL